MEPIVIASSNGSVGIRQAVDLTVRLLLQVADYIRLVIHPDARPIAVPVIETIEVQAQHEIEEALGRENQGREERRS